MRTFLFRVDQANRQAVEKTRDFATDSDASVYARQLLEDWPDCASIDVLQAGQLVDRLRPTQP